MNKLAEIKHLDIQIEKNLSSGAISFFNLADNKPGCSPSWEPEASLFQFPAKIGKEFSLVDFVPEVDLTRLKRENLVHTRAWALEGEIACRLWLVRKSYSSLILNPILSV